MFDTCLFCVRVVVSWSPLHEGNTDSGHHCSYPVLQELMAAAKPIFSQLILGFELYQASLSLTARGGPGERLDLRCKCTQCARCACIVSGMDSCSQNQVTSLKQPAFNRVPSFTLQSAEPPPNFFMLSLPTIMRLHLTTLSPPSLPPSIRSTDKGKLDYDSFFNKKIKEKQNDNSYRKFRVLARSAGRFPTAKQFDDATVEVEKGKDITVWCSNDYLGMGKHPDVINATM